MLHPAFLLASRGTILPAFDEAVVTGNSTDTNTGQSPAAREGNQGQTWFWGRTEVAAAQGDAGCPPPGAGARAGEDAAAVSAAPGLL